MNLFHGLSCIGGTLAVGKYDVSVWITRNGKKTERVKRLEEVRNIVAFGTYLMRIWFIWRVNWHLRLVKDLTVKGKI